MCRFFPLNKRQNRRKQRFWKKTAKKDAVGGRIVKEKIAKNNDLLKEKMKKAAKKDDFF